MRHVRIYRAIATLLVLVPVPSGQASALREATGVARLIGAYPEQLDRIEGNDLVWRDGTRMPIDDAQGIKAFEDWLDHPDIEDMFRLRYPAGAAAHAPAEQFDPGRARNRAFFDKMYGDCRKGEVAANLTEIVWLPRKSGQRIKATRINRVDEKLAAVSAALDALPVGVERFLVPAAGTYNCRAIAGTDRISPHGYGIAIDIALKHAHYWRWSRLGPGGSAAYRNEVPWEIVRVFEQHGFIWGGRWSHFDTMHFEYRPELIVEAP